MVSRWVQEWMKTGQNPIYQFLSSSPAKNSSEATLEEISTLFAPLINLGIQPMLVESAKLTAVEKSIPRLAIAAFEGKRLISSQMSVAEIPMSPTELGKMISGRLKLGRSPSPQQINQALEKAGLQIGQKTVDLQGNKKIEWKLTEAGKKYGQLQMDTARNTIKQYIVFVGFPQLFQLLKLCLYLSQL